MKKSMEMPPYNYAELGFIQNVPMAEQRVFCSVPVYQILPVKYLINILRNKTLRFNNILYAWEDPYELFMFKQKIVIDNYNDCSALLDMQKNFYGQCWSLNKDSDAMWRIYSPDKDGVRIKTSVGKMIEVLNQIRSVMRVAPLFGKVKYLPQNKITEWLLHTQSVENIWIYNLLSDSLFIKRHEFEHENEVRFLLYNGNFENASVHSNIHDDYIDVQVEPAWFIEEIALDPRLSDEDLEDRKNILSSVIGDIPICKSDLYTFESIKLSYKRSVLDPRI